MRALAVAVVVALAALAGACAPDAPAPLWSPDAAADNPLPDERSQDARGVVVTPDVLRRFLPKGIDTTATDTLLVGWSAQLHDAGGWGVFAPVLLRFDAPLDGMTLDEHALAFIALDGAGAPVRARATWHANPGVLEVQPTAPLPQGARVALVVLRSLVGGMRVPRPAGFDGDVDAAAAALGVAGDHVALVVPYRTARSVDGLVRARDLLRDVVPAFRFDDEGDGRHGVFTPATAPLSLTQHPDEIAARLAGAGVVAVGRFTSRDMRDPDTGVFDPAVLDGTVPPHDDEIELVLVEPDPAAFPPPWPAVILQHGFQGSDAFVVDNAAPFLARGLAVLGIDAVSHGQRGNITGFFTLDDPRAIRDNLRQTVVDQLVLSSLAVRGHIDVDGVPGDDLDGSLAYYGHSMGAVLGATFAMVSEDADVVAVNAPGGGLCDVFRSPGLRGSLQYLIRPLLGIGLDDPVYDDAYPLVTAMLQPLLEGADPIAYARKDARPHLLMQLDVDDELVPNGSTRDLAAALGVPERESAHDDGGLDALVALHGDDYGFPADQDPHDLFEMPPAQAQAAQFVATRGADLPDPR